MDVPTFSPQLNEVVELIRTSQREKAFGVLARIGETSPVQTRDLHLLRGVCLINRNRSPKFS